MTSRRMLLLTVFLAQRPSASLSAPVLDYAFSRDQVQPIFLSKMPGHRHAASPATNTEPAAPAVVARRCNLERRALAQEF